MASKSQGLILDAIEAKLTEQGLIVALDTVYANTGVIRSYRPDLTLIGQLDYSFSERKAAFHLPGSVNLYASVTYGRGREPGHIPAVRNEPDGRSSGG